MGVLGGDVTCGRRVGGAGAGASCEIVEETEAGDGAVVAYVLQRCDGFGVQGLLAVELRWRKVQRRAPALRMDVWV